MKGVDEDDSVDGDDDRSVGDHESATIPGWFW